MGSDIINIVSVCDGMAGARIALGRLGKKVDNYYSLEVDKFCKKIANKNYPDIRQLGDVYDFGEDELEKLPKIDLIIGGTPCQNLSNAVAGREEYHTGLQGKKSGLFFHYVRILKWLKENNNSSIKFVLENVGSMKNGDKEIIDKVLQVNGIEINSKYFSAQERLRYYWFNLEVPPLKKVDTNSRVLKDIILDPEDVTKIEENSRMNFWYQEDFEVHEGEKVIATLDINGYDILKRVYDINYKSPTLTTCRGGNTQKKILQNGKPRKLLPIEYERLQTVPDNYTEGVSNTQRYNMLGNGFTIKVIEHILQNL